MNKWGWTCCLLFLGACGDEEEFEVDVSVQMIGFDGVILDSPWVIEYTTWISTVGQIELSNEDDQVVADDNGAAVIEFQEANDPEVALNFDSPAGSWAFNFGNSVPTRTNDRINTVSDTNLTRMIDNGWTHLIAGTAIGPAPVGQTPPEWTFEWGFDAPARHLDCGDGIEVMEVEGGEATIVLLGWIPYGSALGAPDSPTDFAPFAAADVNEDQIITMQELRDTRPSDVGLQGASSLYDYLKFQVALAMRLGEDGTCDTRT